MDNFSNYNELILFIIVIFFVLFSRFLYLKNDNKIKSLAHNALVLTPRKKEILDKKDMLILCLTKEEEIEAINKMKIILKAHFDSPSNKGKSYFIMNKSIEKSFKTNVAYKYAQLMVDAYEEKGISESQYLFALVPSEDTLKKLSQPNYI